MTEQMLRQYTVLVEYLGATLGPDYEVVLHEIPPETSRVARHCQRHHQRPQRRRADHKRGAAHDHAEAVRDERL
ncbi:MAG: hypothetical protein ACLS3C_05030 [Oscillospiraceae bacterium]